MNIVISSSQNYIEKIYQNVNIEEGESAIEQVLLETYFQEGISTKELARKTLLPIPLVAAIKKESFKEKIFIQDRGIRLTAEGRRYIEKQLGFDGLDHGFYHQLLNNPKLFLEQESSRQKKFFDARPQVDVTIDQSKSTSMTSMKRAILCLKHHSLIGKQILCVGDDDLVSISLGFLLKKLFSNIIHHQTQIQVIDIDQRFLGYIQEISELEELPIHCHPIDLRNPLPHELQNRFDCFFTDPPYTLPGMALFLSRGISGLKKKTGLPIFLSFAHKPPEFTLKMQQELQRMELTISEIMPRFNEYEGAEIIGNTGQMLILQTSGRTQPIIKKVYNEAIYTGELKRTLRLYECKECKNLIKVGFNGEFPTIEAAKENGCPICQSKTFILIERSVQS